MRSEDFTRNRGSRALITGVSQKDKGRCEVTAAFVVFCFC